jgi:hypothetical protein
MHARLNGLESPWAQHLERSYFPAPVLLARRPVADELWFLDNGARQLVLDEHCNTAVTRWTLRERGFSLAGADASELVEAVPLEALRSEARQLLEEYANGAPEPTAGTMSRWKQPYLVLMCCRILHTLEAATVESKHALDLGRHR